MPPAEVYAAWSRAQDALVQPVVQDAVDEAEVQAQLLLGEELYGNQPCWEDDVYAEYADDDGGDDDGVYDFGVGEAGVRRVRRRAFLSRQSGHHALGHGVLIVVASET